MIDRKPSYVSNGKAYPIAVSIGMIVIAIILSFVDLAFLNDVIGQILGVGTNESMAMAFALGLVGITIMGHQGLKEARGDEKKSAVITHYGIWISLGLALVLMRLFSASIIDLSSEEVEKLIHLGPLGFRLVDLVISPLMMLLYLATGQMVKDGVKNLLQNPEFDKGWSAWWAAKKAERLARDKRAAQIEKDRLAAQAAAAKEAEDAKIAAGDAIATRKEQARLNKAYTEAEEEYESKRKKMEADFEIFSKNISYIESIDKKQSDFENKTIPGLMKIIQSSIMVVQHNAASAVHKQHGVDITSLRGAIERYNHVRDIEHNIASTSNSTSGINVSTMSKKIAVSEMNPRSGRFIQ